MATADEDVDVVLELDTTVDVEVVVVDDVEDVVVEDVETRESDKVVDGLDEGTLYLNKLSLFGPPQISVASP